MAKANLAFFTFNRGIVSRYATVRSDIKRLALGARQMKNWVGWVLGSMGIRPGLGYIGSTRSDAAARFLDFVFSLSDKALIELTDSTMRVWVNDAVITRPSVTTAVVNGTFPASLANWTDDDEAGATSSWVAPGYMQLLGDGTSAAKRTQQITVAGANIGVEHALKITIVRGPVTLLVGSSAGGDQYISQTDLDEGNHSLALTPTADFYIRFQSTLRRVVWVSNCTIEAAGAMTVATPWTAALLGLVRPASSGDILFNACDGIRQYKIERRGTRSWSVVKYYTEDGPYLIENIGPITMTPSVLNGNGTLTASAAYFKSTNVGGIFRITSTGQTVQATFGVLNAVSASIVVTGVGSGRNITWTLASLTATGDTLQLQRSFDNSTWVDLTGIAYTADGTFNYIDGLDNQTAYYRFKCTVYAAGAPALQLSFAGGSIIGVARVTAYTSTTVVDIEVLSSMGAAAATTNWAEGQWSDRRGWPSGVGFHEGRLWWGGKDKVNGSVSDAFYSYDPETLGDSGPISRSIGTGPVDSINWLLPLQRLILGAQMAEHSCRSTSLDEPLTPTNFNLKPSSTQGSAPVQPIKLDTTGIFVQRGGVRVYELAIDPQTYDYSSTHLTAVNPEIGRPGIVRMAAQRQPETRVHYVRSDGTVALLTFDKNEQVICWSEVETDGLIEDAVVLPGDAETEEDQVYYVVNRTINGSTKRFLERWATEAQCRPDDAGTLTTSRLGDSFVVYSGAPTTSLPATHLEGEQVVVWADGVDIGHDSSDELIYTVTGGVVTLPTEVSNAMVGLAYTAPWQSTKLTQIPTQGGTTLTRTKRISELGLVLADTHARGLKFGRTFADADMNDMPSMENSTTQDVDAIHVDYDEQTFIFPGDFTTDERLCLLAMAPRPCTVLAAVAEVKLNEG